MPGIEPLEEAIRSAPAQPGVYLMRGEDGEVLYVGKAVRLKDRLRSYRDEPDPRKREMLARVASVEVILSGSDKEAWILESNLIKRHRPRYNVILSDDKKYPYIKVTNEPYPRIFVTRTILPDGARYFGPFPDAGPARQVLEYARDAFRIRDCRKLPKRRCINFEIGICTAPCEGLVTQDAYAAQVEAATRFLAGDTREIERRLSREMEEASAAQEFERAARARDMLSNIDATMERQALFSVRLEDRDAVGFVSQARDEGDWCAGVVLPSRAGRVVGREEFTFSRPLSGDALLQFLARYYDDIPVPPGEVLLPELPEGHGALARALSEKRGKPVSFAVPERGEWARLRRLAQQNAELALATHLSRRGESQRLSGEVSAALSLARPVRRVHGFDVSHLAGTEVVAARVAFRDGIPEKDAYRRFKLRQDRNDDFAALREAVLRAYRAEELPDLVLVDGGVGQLRAAVQAFEELGVPGAPLCALAKREELVFVPARREPLRLPEDGGALRLLMRVRDEAHRFAVSYQRVRRSRSISESPLDAVRGLGPKRKRALLAAFNGVEAILAAPPERVAAVVGPELARRIREVLAPARDA
ncbi:MAG TPA: excinuclease ABC subunit UvrC [Candidatus Thermoplasmatota archaeon]|nr:excinuclease ABC subunit UvrC [Candidatus Thermoplasmatota archaeon]